MQRSLIPTIVICVMFIATIAKWFGGSIDGVVARMLLPDVSDFEFYPAAPQMPPVVATPMQDLLAEYEAFLAQDAPTVLEALQPGLSLDEIQRLEKEHNITLTRDLRELYQWRNGTPRESDANAFPYLWFVPLDTALQARATMAQKLENEPDPRKREFYDDWASHRISWIGVILDPAGEGYHFDPQRTEAEGSFFHCGEGYIFYPSVRNYVAQLVEEVRTGRLQYEEGGIAYKTFLSYEEEQAIDNRFGTTVR